MSGPSHLSPPPAIDAGIHCITLPTPFPVGPVNTYLLEGTPLTLVDCGPGSAVALTELERRLALHAREIEDIEMVFITHQHLDHAGLAHLVAARSGAPVVCLALLAPYLEDFERAAEEDDDHSAELLVRHGIDAHVATALRWSSALVRGWGHATRVDRPVEDGTTLVLGARTYRVLHRPGHSPSDTVLVDETRRVALVGDHLLRTISSNAVLSRPLHAGWDGRRRRPLVEYRESLMSTRALDLDLVLTGHGAPIHDHRALIDQRLHDQERRAAQLLEMLAAGPRTAHALAVELWGDIAITQALLTLSEVVGHLDLLIAEGVVAETDHRAVVQFEAV